MDLFSLTLFWSHNLIQIIFHCTLFGKPIILMRFQWDSWLGFHKTCKNIPGQFWQLGVSKFFLLFVNTSGCNLFLSFLPSSFLQRFFFVKEFCQTYIYKSFQFFSDIYIWDKMIHSLLRYDGPGSLSSCYQVEANGEDQDHQQHGGAADGGGGCNCDCFVFQLTRINNITLKTSKSYSKTHLKLLATFSIWFW